MLAGHQRPRPRAPPQRGRDGAGPPPGGRIGDDARRGRLRRRVDRPDAELASHTAAVVAMDALLAGGGRHRGGMTARSPRPPTPWPGWPPGVPDAPSCTFVAAVVDPRRARSPSAGSATAAPTGSPTAAAPGCLTVDDSWAAADDRGRASSTRTPRCAIRAAPPDPVARRRRTRRSPDVDHACAQPRRACCCSAPTGCGTTSPRPRPGRARAAGGDAATGRAPRPPRSPPSPSTPAGADNITVVCHPDRQLSRGAPRMTGFTASRSTRTPTCPRASAASTRSSPCRRPARAGGAARRRGRAWRSSSWTARRRCSGDRISAGPPGRGRSRSRSCATASRSR